MNHITAAMALVTSAALVACSSPALGARPPGPQTSPTETTTPAPAGQPSVTQLTAMALAVSDLPFGWTTSPPSTDSSVTAPCPAITANASRQLPAQAEADFQQSEDGPFLQEILAAGPAQQVRAVWASIQQAASLCSAPAPGATSGTPPTRLSTMPFPSQGDESYALQLTAVRSGVNYSGDVIVIRKGQVFIEVVVFGTGGVSASLVQQLVDRAESKVRS